MRIYPSEMNSCALQYLKSNAVLDEIVTKELNVKKKSCREMRGKKRFANPVRVSSLSFSMKQNKKLFAFKPFYMFATRRTCPKCISTINQDLWSYLSTYVHGWRDPIFLSFKYSKLSTRKPLIGRGRYIMLLMSTLNNHIRSFMSVTLLNENQNVQPTEMNKKKTFFFQNFGDNN